MIEQLRGALVRRAGGYLRNPVRRPQETCAICTTPVDGFTRCIPCNSHARSGHQVADAVAPLTYVVNNTQAHHVMRGYKAPTPVTDGVEVVTLLTMLGIVLHGDCAARRLRAPLTHWSSVPSLPRRPGVHPLRRIARPFAPGQEVVLQAAAQLTDSPRDLNPTHFTVAERLPSGSHVLLLDDTWTTGGHCQSAAGALRAAGARHVSVMVLARYVKADWGNNAAFLKTLTRDFDPGICPWTGGACP